MRLLAKPESADNRLAKNLDSGVRRNDDENGGGLCLD